MLIQNCFSDWPETITEISYHIRFSAMEKENFTAVCAEESRQNIMFLIPCSGYKAGGKSKDAGLPPKELHLLASLSSVLTYTILRAKERQN